MSRLADLERFYGLIDRLKSRLCGTRKLADLRIFREGPRRGVYFFFEPDEVRRDSGEGLRVVRVGTHALTAGSRSTLRQRLGQHRGNASGGNHRGSIFRLLVGQALIARGDVARSASWGVKGDARKAAASLGIDLISVMASEKPVEEAVSGYLATMPWILIAVDDEPGPSSERGRIERNSIALLSNHRRPPLDPPSPGWLGRYSDRELVGGSGLWNQRHVEEEHDPSFLDCFERMIGNLGSRP